MEPHGFIKSLVAFGLAVSHGPWFPQGPAVLQWILASMRSHSAAMLSLVPQCHNGLLVPRGSTVSSMFPSFHESLGSGTGPLGPWVLQCHNGPIITRGPGSVTMLCMVPQGPAVSQWPLASLGPCSVTIITDSPKLEKTLETIESNP